MSCFYSFITTNQVQLITIDNFLDVSMPLTHSHVKHHYLLLGETKALALASKL